MGWTYTDKPKGMTLKEFFTKEFQPIEILDVGTRGWHEAYLACRARDGTVFCLICLVDYKGDRSFNFGYKDMSEDMDPYTYNCPERILNSLSPAKSDYARKWREKCRENLRKQKTLPTLHNGDLVKFKKNLRFRNGVTQDTFYVEKKGRRIRFFPVMPNGELYPTGTIYTISGWQQLDRELVFATGGKVS